MTVIDQVASRQRDLSDAELISSVRGGDVSAYGDLFARHRDAATRLARQLVPGPDADDLVSEAFAKVLNVLLAGGGPDVAFRAYLLTAVRRLHVDKIRATSRATPTDDLTPFETLEPATDTVIAGFEGGAAAKAFASLPERWQLVLWHLEVEGQKPADVAPLLGMSPNSVSALAYRAREGLRQAYLQMHTGDLVDPDCRWTHDKLGAYVRKGLSRRDVQKVENHMDGCRKCTAMYLELNEVNSSLAALLGPLVLGAAASGYLTATGTAGAGLGGVLGLLDRGKDFVIANAQAAVAVGAAAGVAGIATVAVSLSNGTSEAPATIDRPTVNLPATPTDPASPTTREPKPRKTPPTTPPTTSPPPAFAPVAETPDPTESSEPEPTSETDPDKPSVPPITTPTTPTTPPVPVDTTANIGVRLTFSLRPLGILNLKENGLLGNLNATVTGVPAGQKSTITIRVLGGTMTQKGSGCKPSGSTAVCALGPDAPPLTFKVHGVPISATATVTVPNGYTDPVMGNNHDSVLLGLIS